jgi:hypothetical protein
MKIVVGQKLNQTLLHLFLKEPVEVESQEQLIITNPEAVNYVKFVDLSKWDRELEVYVDLRGNVGLVLYLDKEWRLKETKLVW